MCRLPGRHATNILLPHPPLSTEAALPNRPTLARPASSKGDAFSHQGLEFDSIIVHKGHEHVDALPATLAPESRHNVAFEASDTTSRAAADRLLSICQ